MLGKSKKSLAIERASVNKMSHCDFLLNFSRYLFASHSCKSKDVVLDIACGTGYGAPFFTKAKTYLGADISVDALKTAKNSYYADNNNFIQCDASDLPFHDQCFNLIVSFETIEHLIDPKKFLSEISRCSKDGAGIIISTPNRNYKVSWVRNINPYHIREYDIQEFYDLMNEFFEDVEAFMQIPKVSQRILDNIMWTVGKFVSLLPYSLASTLLPSLRKIRLKIFRPAREERQDLLDNHNYEIKAFSKDSFEECQHIILVCKNKKVSDE